MTWSAIGREATRERPRVLQGLSHRNRTGRGLARRSSQSECHCSQNVFVKLSEPPLLLAIETVALEMVSGPATAVHDELGHACAGAVGVGTVSVKLKLALP